MILSDVKAFEAWFKERVGVSYLDAETRQGGMDLRTIKAAYAAGVSRATLETAKVMSQPLAVSLPAPLEQVGWRWKYRDGRHSYVFDGEGPTEQALAWAAASEAFGPCTVEKVYVIAIPK